MHPYITYIRKYIRTYIHIFIYIYIYIYILTFIYIYTYTQTYRYIYTYTYTYNRTHTNTHVYTYGKLFLIRYEILHTQILHRMATNQFNPNKSQDTCFHKMRNTGAGNPTTESSKKVKKS